MAIWQTFFAYSFLILCTVISSSVNNDDRSFNCLSTPPAHHPSLLSLVSLTIPHTSVHPHLSSTSYLHSPTSITLSTQPHLHHCTSPSTYPTLTSPFAFVPIHLVISCLAIQPWPFSPNNEGFLTRIHPLTFINSPIRGYDTEKSDVLYIYLSASSFRFCICTSWLDLASHHGQ